MEPEQLGRTLKLALDAEAARRPPSPDGWLKIERRLRREPWRRAGIAAASIAVAAALAIAASQLASRPGRREPARPGPAHLGQLVVVGETRLPGAGFGTAAGYGAVWVLGPGVTYEVDQATGRLVRTISTPGTFPGGCGSGIATGLGAVWATYGCRGMYRIDARTGQVTASIRVRQAGDVVAVADGLVWVPTYSGDLLRIEPQTGAVTGRPIRIGYGDWTIVPGAGAVWVTSYGTGYPSTLYRVDPATGAVRKFGNPTVTDVAAVGAGSLWTSQVQRVDPATGKVVASFFLPVQGPGDVAFWRGQAWALTLQRAAAIVRIDPAVNRVVGAPTRLAGSAGPIASGPAGLWVIAEGLLLHLGIRGDAAAAALPAVGAPGFPASIYPPPASRKELNLAGRCPGGRHRPGPQLPLRSAPDRPGVLAAGPCQLARRNRHQALRARTRAVLGAAAVLPPGVRPAGHEPHDPGRVRPPDRRRHLDDRHRPGNAPGPESGMPATRRALPADNHQRCRRCEPWPVQSRECWSPT